MKKFVLLALIIGSVSVSQACDGDKDKKKDKETPAKPTLVTDGFSL